MIRLVRSAPTNGGVLRGWESPMCSRGKLARASHRGATKSCVAYLTIATHWGHFLDGAYNLRVIFRIQPRGKNSQGIRGNSNTGTRATIRKT